MNEFKALSIQIANEQELQTFSRILDWAQRHAGADGTMAIAHFMQKLHGASIAAQRAETEAPDLKAVA